MWFLGSEEPPSGFGVGGSVPEVGAGAAGDLVASDGDGEGEEDLEAAAEGAGEIVAGAAGVGVEEAMDSAAWAEVGPRVAAAPRAEAVASAAQEGAW